MFYYKSHGSFSSNRREIELYLHERKNCLCNGVFNRMFQLGHNHGVMPLVVVWGHKYIYLFWFISSFFLFVFPLCYLVSPFGINEGPKFNRKPHLKISTVLSINLLQI